MEVGPKVAASTGIRMFTSARAHDRVHAQGTPLVMVMMRNGSMAPMGGARGRKLPGGRVKCQGAPCPAKLKAMSEETRQWSSNGYFVCSHSGCSKKIDDSITDHDCCDKPKHWGEH